MLSRFGAWLAVALLAAVVLVGCGKETKKEANPPTVTQVSVTYVVPTAGPSTPTAASGGAATPAATQPATGGAQQAVTVEMVDIAFKPTAFTIPANQDVTVTLTNTGATLHNFSITDHKNPGVKNLGISVNVDAGQTKTVTINAPAGSYYYYCDVPGHEAAGMHGMMTVSANAPAQGSSPVASPAAASSPVAAASPVAGVSPASASSPVAVASPSAALSPIVVASPSAAPSPTAVASPSAASSTSVLPPIAAFTAASPVAASPVASAAAASPAASPAASGPIALQLEDIKFSTNSLAIPANTDVTIHLTNTGGIAHNFNIDQLNIHSGDVQAGASMDAKINAPAGSYTYYCNIPGHEAAGMKGTLTVK